uniref:CLAVATA3/ESR (CLE)-related protein 46 n=1 Tax=Noccaea caerulescens TaxID=107243 RepID=A0A1J3JJK0_NOCCA
MILYENNKLSLPKTMRRHVIIKLLLLLLICLFLGRIMPRQCQEVHIKIGPAKISTRPNYERVMPISVEETRWHKHLSGPNPSGNRHPPAKP